MNISKHCHLVGIGGIGMSGIAKLLLRGNLKVSGSDLKETRTTEELRKLGAEVFIGHNPENTRGADLIIYSSAIKDDNPEIAQAKAKGIPLMKRAEALARLMSDKIVVTVTGSHGKTTTASLVSYLLLEAGLSPTVAVGGILKNIDTNACAGGGNFFVAEADESDGSFLYYQPKYSIITNIDYEHLDYYKSFENEMKAFGEFINRTEKEGCVFACGDDMNLKNMLDSYKNRYILFGLNETGDIYAKNIRLEGLSSEFDCFCGNKLSQSLGARAGFIGRFYLALGGKHNISNALSVIALGLKLGIDLETIKKTLKSYKGSSRRLEIKFEHKGLMVIDDYAHHPAEIKATLEAVKNLKHVRIIAIFQPHRYTRTKLLLDEFSKSFDFADCVIITDIYPAAEAPLEGVSGEAVYHKIKERSPGKEAYFLAKDRIVRYLLEMVKPGDIVIALGAGDIVKISSELVEELKKITIPTS